jgi:hypothetical protein
MKLDQVFENPSQGVAMGSNILKKVVGGKASGQMTARALDQMQSGSMLSRSLIDALEPYANILSDIMEDPKYRARFLQLVRQMHQDKMKGKEVESIEEAYFPSPEVMPGAVEQEDDKETVSYSKTKKQGDAQVTISANADSMQELHDILKLAGITLPKTDKEQPEQEQPEMEPEVDMDDECGCDDEPESAPSVLVKPKLDNPSYSTDKETLINVLKDRLKNALT